MSSASNRQLKLQKQLATDVLLESFCKHLIQLFFSEHLPRTHFISIKQKMRDSMEG